MNFSVVIPLYNKAPYIEKAIQSVLAQTHKEFELIIVDDGSTDNSFEIIQKYKSDKIHIIAQENQGVSSTRNNGVKVAKFDYIAFLDADDWWAPTFLENLKMLIEEFPKAGIYGSSYYKVKDGRQIPANIGVDNSFNRGLINYYQVYAKTLWMPLTSISVVIPKKVYQEVGGFNPQLKLGEDFDLWVRIAQKYPVAYVNKLLAYYNQDVDMSNRAIGQKLYTPQEHMLFTDYGDMMDNIHFNFLYQRLALYGLLPYYINNKNTVEVNRILHLIDWGKHEAKYKIYYRVVPRIVLKMYFSLLKTGIFIKRALKK